MPEENTIKNSAEFISASQDINVEEIMESINRKIEEKKKSGVLKQSEVEEIADMELLPLPDFLEIPNVYEPHLYPEKKVEDFKPYHFEPEIETGRVKSILRKIRSLIFPLLRFMTRPIDTEVKNLTVKLHNQNKEEIHRLKQMVPIVFQSKEYIKLLHNAINNIIVEFSKLKIEEELLKTKIKVLEDKIEFLENRQRSIEKKLFEK